MKLRDVLQLLKISKVTLFSESNKKQFKPTRNLDESGRKYLEILSPKMLDVQVSKIVPTAFGFANVYIIDDSFGTIWS